MTNNGGATTFTFTGNGTFTFEFIDSYGNTGSEIATVNWIDKIAPYATSLTYNPTGNSNTGVVVTLITSENIQTLSGWTGTGTTRTKSYTTNTTETINFYDLVGNTGSTGINISWIDTSPVS